MIVSFEAANSGLGISYFTRALYFVFCVGAKYHKTIGGLRLAVYRLAKGDLTTRIHRCSKIEKIELVMLAKISNDGGFVCKALIE